MARNSQREIPLILQVARPPPRLKPPCSHPPRPQIRLRPSRDPHSSPHTATYAGSIISKVENPHADAEDERVIPGTTSNCQDCRDTFYLRRITSYMRYAALGHSLRPSNQTGRTRANDGVRIEGPGSITQELSSITGA